MSKAKLQSRENSSLKMKGAGDGAKLSSHRVPVPSSRKFTATPIKNDEMALKLHKALQDIEGKKLKKAKSIAEITPTKHITKRPKRKSEVELHATPRFPPVDANVEKTSPSRRQNEQLRFKQLQLLVCFRMSVKAWRQNKARQARLSESLQWRQEQILKLEKQVECLKDLNQSECAKREEAVNHNQQLESLLKNVQSDNENFQRVKEFLESEVYTFKNNLQLSNITVENLKNDLNSKNCYVKRLESDLGKDRQLVKDLKEEKALMNTQIKKREVELKLQEEHIEKLNEEVKNYEHKLKSVESTRKCQVHEFNKLNQNYQDVVKKNEDMVSELQIVKSENETLRLKIDDLEANLARINYDFNRIFNENEEMKKLMPPKWWRNAKSFMAISWVILQNAVYIMLPAAL